MVERLTGAERSLAAIEAAVSAMREAGLRDSPAYVRVLAARAVVLGVVDRERAAAGRSPEAVAGELADALGWESGGRR